MPALGRVEGPADERDKRYPMSIVLKPLEALPVPRYRYWVPWKTVLDQGNVGACVGFAGAGWMGCSPVRTPVTNETGLQLYRECKKIDGIPQQEGTYARALLDVLRAEGRIANYLWAQSPADIQRWVLTQGSVLVGTAWYERMMSTDEDGFVHREGRIIGGHEYLITGYNQTRGVYRAINSWGPHWGDRGRFWLTGNDLHALLWQDWGDAVGVVEKPVLGLHE